MSSPRNWKLAFALLEVWTAVSSSPLRADDLLFRYEGDVLPSDPSSGWTVFDACSSPCEASVVDSRLSFLWTSGGDEISYFRGIARIGETAPPNLWSEWRFRSDEPFISSTGCDATFVVQFRNTHDLVYLFGDTIISASGDHARTGLAIDAFHTYRFESLDGAYYCFFSDGKKLYCHMDQKTDDWGSFVLFAGHGGCSLARQPTINEWDYVRYGTIGFGEKMIASDPPSGFIDLRHQTPPDRFAITFDQPNYVFVENITVGVTGVGTKPVVNATWRRDQDGPQSLEVVLDRPIPANATTRFIMNDGEIVNTVRYTTKLGDVDGNGDTDLAELAAFQNCFNHPTPDPACGALDLNENALIDLPDLPQLLDPLLIGPK